MCWQSGNNAALNPAPKSYKGIKMIFQITHHYTLRKDFVAVETNLDRSEFEKVLFYIEAIHMGHMPNLPYVLDDSISEKDVAELLPILYKDSEYSFKPLYEDPNQTFEVIDLWKIENSFGTYKKHLPDINNKYALPNATLSLMKYYQSEVIATLKKDYVLNHTEYSTVEENELNYKREADLLDKVIKGEDIKPEWNLSSFFQKDLTGMRFIPSNEKEFLA